MEAIYVLPLLCKDPYHGVGSCICFTPEKYYIIHLQLLFEVNNQRRKYFNMCHWISERNIYTYASCIFGFPPRCLLRDGRIAHEHHRIVVVEGFKGPSVQRIETFNVILNAWQERNDGCQNLWWYILVLKHFFIPHMIETIYWEVWNALYRTIKIQKHEDRC